MKTRKRTLAASFVVLALLWWGLSAAADATVTRYRNVALEKHDPDGGYRFNRNDSSGPGKNDLFIFLGLVWLCIVLLAAYFNTDFGRWVQRVTSINAAGINVTMVVCMLAGWIGYGWLIGRAARATRYANR